MGNSTLLNLVLYLPLVSAILVLLVPASKDSLVKSLSLGLMLIGFVLSVPLYTGFDPNDTALQFKTSIPWISSWGISYIIGMDGINILLIMLTTFLGPIVVLSTFSAVEKSVNLFYAMIFMLQFTMLGAFVAQNLFVFYLFWEAMLIPMFFIIGIWGGKRRIYATVKFFLYTALGSIIMLTAVIYLAYINFKQTGTMSYDFVDLYKVSVSPDIQKWLFLAFALSFAIKVPMFPFHTWLPDAHVEAPTAGSVILAGVLLKMGTYGFMRLAMPLFPEAAVAFAPLMKLIAVIGIVYGACLALAQTDIKKLIAYSSISHLGYVMLGLFSFNQLAVEGAILQMVNHGISTGALFLMVGMIYERRHSREIADYGGIASIIPRFAFFFMIVTLSSIALPGTNGFVGEFLILLGAFNDGYSVFKADGGSFELFLSSIAVSGVIIGAFYMLWLVQRFMFGPVVHEKNKELRDLNSREIGVLIPMVVMIFWIGLFPSSFFNKIDKSVTEFLKDYKRVEKSITSTVQHVEGVQNECGKYTLRDAS
ncbi:NADH-quinone oxidoreductase subunit M [Deltaproteobacteria bacterium TL4]